MPDVRTGSSFGSFNVARTGGATLVSLDLPAGQWLVQGTVQVSSSANDLFADNSRLVQFRANPGASDTYAQAGLGGWSSARNDGVSQRGITYLGVRNGSQTVDLVCATNGKHVSAYNAVLMPRRSTADPHA